ncbi:hypothetical protein, conserved [Babesia ovata]|uniref:Uncharacterized protein n=1 Tax=Babesia ovata TaxID=189622 RepID=A0A2H6KBD5_9APIC|nr:uncharacterized protein BOVATA_017900 [Babesia ovata]GBE60297.1 hypothetical protein, conserved [Babesia ovata]
MVYNSLTEAPRNVKECIDWLIALKGKDGEKNLKALGDAIHKFLADKPVGFTELPALEKVKLISKEFLEQEGLKGQWSVSKLLGRFNKPMDKSKCTGFFKSQSVMYDSDLKNIIQTEDVDAEEIAGDLAHVVNGCEFFLQNVKVPDQYKSAYSSKATWESSCAQDPEACAVVFVGIAPMLYVGLHSLRRTSKIPFFWESSQDKERVGEILKVVGFKAPECRDSLAPSDVREALRGVGPHILDFIYDLSGFWAFY